MRNSEDEPIENASVVWYSAQEKILAYTTTDNQGRYALRHSLSSGDFIAVNHLFYKKQKQVISNALLHQQEITLNFALERKEINMIDKVVIKGKRDAAKDTVKLALKNLVLQADDNLKTILKKIPYFVLGEDGTILYRGKNIDKILVNKKSSFDHQNSIALENIQKKMIKSISVINNYEDNFSVSFNEDKETVLNIDTEHPNQRLLTGNVLTAYGYRDKYHLEGNGFLFWNGLNAFTTHNTNDISKMTITSQEIKALFTQNQPFSSYRLNNLNALFTTEENVKKDFFTGTTLTLRKQAKRWKTFGLLYYLAPNRANQVSENLSSLNDTPFLQRENHFENQLHSFLGTAGGAYKISKHTLAYYSINIDHTQKKNKGTSENQFFGEQEKTMPGAIASFYGDKTFSSFQKVTLKSKLNSKLILEANTSYYHEGTDLNREYAYKNDAKKPAMSQDYRYSMQQGDYNIGLTRKISEALIPSLFAYYTFARDKINDNKQENANLIYRKAQKELLNLNVKGNKVFKSLRYEMNAGFKFLQTDITAQKNHRYFMPVNAFLDYENKLSRYRVQYLREINPNHLETGIQNFVSYYTTLQGDSSFPLHFSTRSKLSVGYYYDDLFDGKSFSISVTCQKQKNILRQYFISQQEGITQLALFEANKIESLKFSSWYAWVLFPLKYPAKFEMGINYKTARYPSFIEKIPVRQTTQNLAQKFEITTLTHHFLNFKWQSQITFQRNKNPQNTYPAEYFCHTFSILIRDKKWNGNLSFAYHQDDINHKKYNRKNLNATIAYAKNKMTFSLEARHFGEVFSFFHNANYNTRLETGNGIISRTIYPESLSYIVFGVKLNI